MNRGSVVETLNSSEVHWLPNTVLASGHLNVAAIQLHLDVERSCLEGQRTVDADCLANGVLGGVDFVKAGRGRNVMVGKIREEVDMIWKITLNPELLNGLFVFGDLVQRFRKDIEDEGVGILSGLIGKSGKYAKQLTCHYFLNPFQANLLKIRRSALAPPQLVV